MAAYQIRDSETGKILLNYTDLLKERFIFIRSMDIQELYDIPDASILPNLHTEVALGYVGRSSVHSLTTLKNTDTGIELARNVMQTIAVDKKTLKPSAVPTWWREQYVDKTIERPSRRVNAFHVPDQTYSYEMKVPGCEIDRWQHTNYSSYTRFCFNAAMDAMRAGFYSTFLRDDDILSYNVMRMSPVYHGDSRAGDIILIRTWENENNPYLLHFDFSKDGKTCYQNSVEFYK